MIRRSLFACALALSLPIAARAADLTPGTLLTQLKAEPKGDDAKALAAQVQKWFGGEANLKKGPGPKIEGTTVAWEGSSVPERPVPRPRSSRRTASPRSR